MTRPCRDCRYWTALFSEREQVRLCKRYPQDVSKAADDTCGEWQERR